MIPNFHYNPTMEGESMDTTRRLLNEILSKFLTWSTTILCHEESINLWNPKDAMALLHILWGFVAHLSEYLGGGEVPMDLVHGESQHPLHRMCIFLDAEDTI